MTDQIKTAAPPEEPSGIRTDGPERESSFPGSPARNLLLIMLCMFGAEITIMLIMEKFSFLPLYQKAILDSLLLMILLVPGLYYFVLKPMQQYVENQHMLEKMIFEIEEREHRRIGKRLHDSLGQILTGVAFQSKVLERKLEKNLPEEAAFMGQITAHVNSAANEARLLAHDLRSIGTQGDSLLSALNELAALSEESFEIPCRFLHDDDISIQNKTAVTHLYRIAQEAVANAVRHGNPGRVEIRLTRKGGAVTLGISDNGKGFDKWSRQAAGMGIQIMRYRARTINASLEIDTEQGKGTRVMCTLHDREQKAQGD